MVTRSQIDAANPELVLALIDSWRSTAAGLETAADDYVRLVERPGGQSWSGRTAEATMTMSHSDRKTIVGGADEVTGMANRTYRAVTESVMPKLSNVRAMIDNAERQGFVVNDDLSVSWTRPSGISDASAEKYQQATGQFSQQIKAAATEWWAAEQRVAEQMDRDRGGLRTPFSTASDGRPHIQNVDHHSFKQDPPPPPGPPGNPFAGWTDEQMAQVANEIAHGHAWPEHANDFPKGWTEQDLARWIYDTMKSPTTQTGTSLKSGGVALLRDGKIVFVDPKGPDFGTAYAPRPLPGGTWQTPEEYFKQHTRELERLPPPTPGKLPPLNPNEMAPPPAASVSPPRGEEGVPAAEPRAEPPAGRGGATAPEGGSGSPGTRTGGPGPNTGAGGTPGGIRGGGGNLRPFPLPGRPPI